MKKLLLILVIILFSCSSDEEEGCNCVMINETIGDVKGNYICRGVKNSNSSEEYLIGLGKCADYGKEE